MELTTGSPAGERHNCGSVQIINGQGRFNLPSCEKFQKDVKLADYKRSYALVSIIGPQSSGKSTLLNNVFGTTFAQMDTLGGGRARCTDGIWLERADITEPCILVMDLEGTDGKEKQDNTTFEKQSAVFALLISDVVLINMWYHEIGRQQAANRPFLETVFQAVMRLLSRRKTTLMFVIHDTDDIKTLCKMSTGRKKSSFDKYSKISEEKWKAKQKENLKEMEGSLKEDIWRIWDSVSKPEAHKRTPFCAFYNIEVVFLSRPSDVQFDNELDRLSQEFHHSIVPGVLAGDREDVVDGSSFSCNAQLLWKKIKENEDLDLPDHKIMVATVRCEQIANEKFESFFASKEWLTLRKAVQTPKISDFGKELSEMIKNCLSSYDEEATYLDRDVKLKKRKQLEEKLVQHVCPTYQDMLQRIKSECLENFKKAFNDLHVGGEKLIVVARKCVDSTITQFEGKRRDAWIDQANRDKSVELLRELKHHMASHIYTVAKQMHGKDRTNFKKLLMKGSAQAVIPNSSEPALNIASQPAAVEAVASAVGVAVKLAVGAIKPAVATGASAPVVAVGAGFGVGVVAVGAAAAAAKYEKRKMTKIINYIVEELLNLPSSACKENELNLLFSVGPSSVCGEN